MIRIFTQLFILLCLPFSGLRAEQQIVKGMWLEVRGQHTGGLSFVAEKISLGTPEDEAALTGTVSQNTNGTLLVLGHELAFEDDAEFEGIDRQTMVGRRVKVQGELLGPKTFSVEKAKARSAGRNRIEGPVDDVVRSANNLAIQILGYQIQVNGNIEFEDFKIAKVQKLRKTEAPRLFASQLSLYNLDDDDRFGSGISISDSIHVTSRIVAESAWEDNFNFDKNDNENRQDLGLSVRSRLEWNPMWQWNGVFELRYRARHRERQDRRKEDESSLAIGEAFLTRNLSEVTRISVGRQDFDDNREWLYDQNLDAIRLQSTWQGTQLEASLSRILSDDGSREEDAKNLFLSASRVITHGTVSTYLLHREFGSEHQEDSYHYGIRALGSWFNTDQLWLELSRQGGTRNRATIEAFGIDLGGTMRIGQAKNWYATVGLAYATGDDPGTRADETFRQTGLQDNNGRFGGLVSFRYYGELSDPELSNLWITTVGIGKRLLPELSIDFVTHSYRLAEKTTPPNEAEWDSETSGSSGNLGWEADVIVGFREQKRWEVEAVFGYFDPGNAFVHTRPAWFAKLQLKLRH